MVANNCDSAAAFDRYGVCSGKTRDQCVSSPILNRKRRDDARLCCRCQSAVARARMRRKIAPFVRGDLVDLPQLLAIANEFDALLYIDDAHGFGVLGAQGHGILEHYNIHASNLIYMGTLGKSAGIAGAFVVAQQAWIDWLIQKARAIIYSTAPPPNLAFALLKSIDLITGLEGAKRRSHLNTLIEYWTTHAMFSKWISISSKTAIQPLIIGSNIEVLRVSEQLSNANLWVPAIRPPTVPINTGRLRIALNALHEIDHLEILIHRLKEIQ